jgi:hypothetical protein
MRLKIVVATLFAFLSCNNHHEKMIVNLRNDTINLEIYGYEKNENPNSETGIYGYRLANQEEISLNYYSDSLIIKNIHSLDKIGFKYEKLKIFMYTPSGEDSGLFNSSIGDTLYCKEFLTADFRKIEPKIEIKK